MTNKKPSKKAASDAGKKLATKDTPKKEKSKAAGTLGRA